MSIPHESTVFELDASKIQSVQLEPEEVFVITRVDGQSTLGQIAAIVGYDIARVWKLFSRAVDAKILKVKGGGAIPPPKKFTKTGSTILEQLDQEDQDPILSLLPRPRRNDILLRVGEMSKQTYYEVLDVTPKATRNEINSKYMKLVKDFHPDRFFGKKMGHYKEKLETLFNRMTEAFSVLSDEKKRNAYNRTIQKEVEPGKKGTEKTEGLKLTGNTLIEKLTRAKHFSEMGKVEEGNGNELSAANFYQMALQLDPNNKELEKKLERLSPFILRKRADDTYNEAKKALEFGYSESARDLLEEALKLNPRKRECYRDLTLYYYKQGKDLKKARSFGEQAVKLFPQDFALKITLGSIYLELGMKEEAKQEFKNVLKVDKTNEQALNGLEMAKNK